MTTHFNILAWRISWTEEPGGLESMGSQKVTQNIGPCNHKSGNRNTNGQFRYDNSKN